uniref:Uncharacterized protein n=1 Tax=Anguilla anguilla TaxID=7936 RepID=A0A0E9W241_ANGAN
MGKTKDFNKLRQGTKSLTGRNLQTTKSSKKQDKNTETQKRGKTGQVGHRQANNR